MFLIYLYSIDHLKRKHPSTLNSAFVNEEDPDSELQTVNNLTTPSTSTISSSLPNNTLTTPKQYLEPPVKRQRQLRLYGSAKKNELSDAENKSIDKALVKMIVSDYQPLSMVDNIGFKEYTNILQPLYTPPSRKLLSTKLLPTEYNVIVSKLKGMLRTVLYVSVTTDMWTSDSNKAYITVTCHFIFDDILYSPVLATKELNDLHTGENIAASLKLIFDEWEINNKIVTVVSDNGANIKNAINQHLYKHHHPCVAHTLNLSVNEAINNNSELSQILQTCKTIVGHFKHSTSATEKLKMYQNQMGLPQLKVKQDVSTRWNSKLILMERLLQIKAPLSAAITSLPRAPNGLTAVEWELIEDCIPLLKPFESMTTELSGEKYPTLSMVIPLIRGLQFTLGNIKPKTNPGQLLKTALSNSISRRLGSLEGDKISSKSTFMDPRLKKMAFGLMENANKVQKWIEEELCTIISENINEDTINNVTIPHDDTSIQDQTSLLWKHFDSKLAQVKTTATPSVMVTLMIRQYLEMPHLERTKNPLDFWKKYKLTFPELYKISLKYLCVPATSVPAERVFSKTGLITNDRRNRLSPKNLDYIIFLNSNLNLF